MGDPVTIMMAAGLALSTVSAVGQGRAAKAASAFERQQYEEEAETNRVAALEDENARRRDLRATLAAQEVYFGANGLDPNSPTALALREETIGMAEDDISLAKLNFGNRARRNQLAAGQSAAAGRSAEIGSYLDAGAGLLQFGSKYAKTGSVPKGGGTLSLGDNLAKYGR